MEDLIIRKSVLEAVKIPNGEYSNPSERHGIIIARVEIRRRIMEIPSVPAVPLEPLCVWLAGYASPPLYAIKQAYDPDKSNEQNRFEAWKYHFRELMKSGLMDTEGEDGEK